MKRIEVPLLTGDDLAKLEELNQKTMTPRYRTRAQMVLLAAEKGMKAEEIAEITRESYM